MGFFKNVGKSLKGLTKMVSIKNGIGLITGQKGIGSLGKEAIGRVLTPHIKTAPTPSINPQISIQEAENWLLTRPRDAKGNLIKSQHLNKTAPQFDAKGAPLSTGIPVIDAAIGGALGGVGAHIGGTSAVNAGTGAVASSAFHEWLKKNWYYVVGGLSAIGGIIYLIVRKPKRKAFGKR